MSWRNPKMKKKNLKKLLCLTAAFALCLALAACSGGTGDTQSSDTGSTAPSDTGGDGGDAGNAEEVKIGIIQLVNHPSLNNCYEGTIQGLAEAGYVDGENGVTIDTKVADGKSETTDMMAKTMVSSAYDMIIAIATPAAMSAYSAARDAGIPVIYSAVSRSHQRRAGQGPGRSPDRCQRYQGCPQPGGADADDSCSSARGRDHRHPLYHQRAQLPEPPGGL